MKPRQITAVTALALAAVVAGAAMAQDKGASIKGEKERCYGVSKAVFPDSSKIDDAVLQVMEVYAHMIYLVEEGQVMDSLSDTGVRMYIPRPR